MFIRNPPAPDFPVFQWFRLSEANLIMVYMVGVLLSSYVADKKIYALYSALISVLSFNFFFTEPYFSLKAYDKGSPVTFAMLFAVGFFMASMTCLLYTSPSPRD